jgi:hypothetical protein
MLLLMGNRLPRLALALFFVGILVIVLINRFSPALVAPSTDQIGNIGWTMTKVTFDYQPAENCPKLTFHVTYRDVANNELASDDFVANGSYNAGVRYSETLTLTPGSTVPATTSRIVISPACMRASPAPSLNR